MDDAFKGKRLLSVKETARFLGISAQTIYNGVCRKAKKPFPVTPIRIGSRIRFDVQDLDTYIESKKAENRADDSIRGNPNFKDNDEKPKNSLIIKSQDKRRF